MPSQRNDLQHTAVVVIDMANDLSIRWASFADAGGLDYQERAQRIIPPLGRLSRRRAAAGHGRVRRPCHTSGDAFQPGTIWYGGGRAEGVHGTRRIERARVLRPGTRPTRRVSSGRLTSWWYEWSAVGAGR